MHQKLDVEGFWVFLSLSKIGLILYCHLRRFAEPPDSALDDLDLIAFGDLDLETDLDLDADLDLATGDAEPHDDPLLLGAGDPWLARDPDLEREFLSDPLDLDLDLDIDLDLDLEKDCDADFDCDLDLDLDLDKARPAELAWLGLLDEDLPLLLDPKFSSSSDEESIFIVLQRSNTAISGCCLHVCFTDKQQQRQQSSGLGMLLLLSPMSLPSTAMPPLP